MVAAELEAVNSQFLALNMLAEPTIIQGGVPTKLLYMSYYLLTHQVRTSTFNVVLMTHELWRLTDEQGAR